MRPLVVVRFLSLCGSFLLGNSMDSLFAVYIGKFQPFPSVGSSQERSIAPSARLDLRWLPRDTHSRAEDLTHSFFRLAVPARSFSEGRPCPPVPRRCLFDLDRGVRFIFPHVFTKLRLARLLFPPASALGRGFVGGHNWDFFFS